jgi:hypothetical protein
MPVAHLDPRLHRLRLVCSICCAATATTATLSAIALFPSEIVHPVFWLKIAWVVTLAVIVWAAVHEFVSAPLRTDQSRRGLGRLTPAFAVGAISYASLSLLLLGLQAGAAKLDLTGAERLLLVAQIVLTGAAVVTGVLLGVASVHGERSGDNVGSQRPGV